MQQRYYSLDVFRGATVALMILVNNPGSWDHIFTPLDHAPWHGCTPTDLVFPFFLFAVGNAMAFSMDKLREKGNAFFIRKTIRRALLLYAIGILLGWTPFFKWDNDHLIPKAWEHVRILGVLQRIAISFLFASILIYFLKPRQAMVAGALILLAYWGLCLFFGNPSDPYALQGYFGTRVDISLLGTNHIYKGEGVPFDPEGIMSSMSAIVQVMLGYFIGQHIRNKGKNFEMLSQLFFIGVVLITVGLLWDLAFPINKKIWTGSYTIYTTGLATLTIGCLIYLLEFNNYKGKWSRFFDAFGKNPLFIFVLSGFLPRLFSLIRIEEHRVDENGKPVLLTPFGWMYHHIFKNWSADLRVGSLAYAVFLIFFYWSIVYWMDRKKIYVKV